MTYLSRFLEQFENKQEENKPMGETVINFGRHKGATYDHIYENDKQYVKWIITNKDEKYIKKIKAYFVERIEKDYAD